MAETLAAIRSRYDPELLDYAMYADLRSLARTYVCDALSNPTEVLRVHPLGFLRIKTHHATGRYKLRFHIWSSRFFAASSPYRIHSHFYAARSLVLNGVVTDTIYSVNTTDFASGLLAEVIHNPVDSSKVLQTKPGFVEAAVLRSRTITSGSTYYLEPDVFHTTSAMDQDTTVTMFIEFENPGITTGGRVVIDDVDDRQEYTSDVLDLSRRVGLSEAIRAALAP
jgi:hypothetical protein